MTRDADTGIIRQHTIQALAHRIGSIGDDDLTGIFTARYTDSGVPALTGSDVVQLEPTG